MDITLIITRVYVWVCFVAVITVQWLMLKLLLTAPELVSQTKNVGSIKGMFASRAQAKAINNHVLPAGDAGDAASSK